MTQANWNLEWLNLNSQRAYPVTMDSSQQDVTGSFQLPTDFLVTLRLPISAGLNIVPGNFFIKSVANYATGFGIVVGYNGTGGPVAVASALIARAAFTPYSQYALGGVGDFAGCNGYIVLGKLDSIDQQPAGLFNFDINGARLEPDCIVPTVSGLNGLIIVNGTDVSNLITGNVRLTAGANFRITPIITSGQDPQLVFDAIEGVGLTETCVCEGDTTAVPIATINGEAGTANGNFVVLGDNCLQVIPITNGIQIKDVCSQPCCGCQELQTITQALEEFGAQATTLENFLTSLESSVQNMDQIVLGSKLGDAGCNTCA